MKFLNHLHFFAFVTCLLPAGNLAAQDVSDEYSDAMSEASEVADWDTNNDGMLDAHEFYVVNYRIWDTDDDSRISQEEWQAGTDNYLAVDRSRDMAMFGDMDLDKNDSLDVNEFTMVMIESDPFDFETDAPGRMNTDQDMQSNMAQMDTTQMEQGQTMQDPTVMIWQMDNDDLIEKITYGDWQIRLDEDDN
jgi:hypothetical protein